MATLRRVTVLVAGGVFLLESRSVSAGPATPANDDFADAIVISDPLPYNNSQSTAGATFETGEPDSCVNTLKPSKTVWYTYTPGATRTVTLDLSGSSFAAAAVIWEGTSLGSLTRIVCDPTSQEIIFQANAGETYAFQIQGRSGTSGTLDIDLSANALPAKGNDDDANSLEISNPLPFSNKQDTQGATMAQDDPCTVSSVWYSYTPDADMGLTADTLGSDFDAVIGIITDLNPSTFNGSCWGSEVTFFLKAGVTVWFEVGGEGSSTGNLASSTGNLVFNLAEFPLIPAPTPPPPAPTPGGPEMVLNIKGGDCDDPNRPSACDVPTGSEFSLSVDAVAVPPESYILMQTFVEFGPDLTYKPTDELIDEILWPDCDPVVAVRSRIDQTRPFPAVPHINSHSVVSHACISSLIPPRPLSNYVGNLVEFTLTCPQNPASSNVKLLPYADTFTTVAGTNGSLFTKPDSDKFIPKLGSLTINCVGPTPTPAGPVGLGQMTGGGHIETTGAGRVTHGFTLQCDPSDPPNRLQVNWAGNIFHLEQLQLAICTDNPGISPNPPTANFDTYIGSGTGRLNGVSGATAEWTFTDTGQPGRNDLMVLVIKDAGGNTVLDVGGNLAGGNHQAHGPSGPPRDTDTDGCQDLAELGAEPRQGGQRDPLNPWDFYDTNGDGTIDLVNDVLGVILAFRTYDVVYDRGPSTGPNPWNMTAPDGVIDLPNDILGVIQQFGHDCE